MTLRRRIAQRVRTQTAATPVTEGGLVGRAVRACDFAGLLIVLSLLSTQSWAQCTNCTTTTVGGDVVHTFTVNGTFTPPAGVTSVRYLVVGGGAGGGGVFNGSNLGGGGGGGAGGYQSGTGFAVTPPTVYNIVVGGGGTAGVGNVSQGGSGGASSFSTVTSAGGGGGASPGVNNNGNAGASGGGGRISGTGGGGTGGQGNAGGNGSTSGGSGGGGGASGVGAAGAGTGSGAGGTGTVNNITGANVTYAAGGAGGSYGSPRVAGTNGTAGTGGGGGGATGDNGGGAFTGGAGGSGIVIIRYALTTTLATGTDPAATTIAPGAAATDVNLFTLQTSSGTEAITSVTVNLSTSNGVGRLAITDNAGTELGFTTTPVTGANSITVAGMTASTTLTTFRVRVTPLSHAAMPPPAGAAYAITAPVTAWAGPNTHVGSDTNVNALTIDNLSPASATATSGARGVGNSTLNWTTSVSGDFATTSGSVLYRWTGASAGAEVPAEGSAPAVGATNGTATVACVVSSAASTALSRIDGTGGTPGVCTTAALPVGPYTYRVFQTDSRGNFDTGVTVTPAAAPPVVQAGRVALNDTSVTQQFTNVCFDQPFSATPVVFSLPTDDGSDPAALRIRNVTPTGFEISVVEPSAMDGRHAAQTVDFLAIEPGTFTLPSGATLVTGVVSTAANQSKLLPGSSWTAVPFASSYGSAPAVLAMIQTMRNETGTPPDTSSVPWLTTAMRNVTGTGFDLALERAESTAGTITQNEDIGYLAIDDGQSGALTAQLNFESIRSADFIQGWDNGCYTTNFATTYGSTPLVIATQNTRDGGDGGWLRRCGISTSNVSLTVDEDTDNDAERAHTAERAGILVLSGTFGMHVCTPVLNHIRIEHTGEGLTCEPSTVTVKACTDAACSTLYTGSVTTTLSPTGWVGGDTINFSGGSTTAQLRRTTLGTVTLGAGTTTPAPAVATRCFNGVTETCSFDFKDTGFIFSAISTQIAGTTSATHTLQAVRTDLSTGVCTGLFTGNVPNIELASECINPGTCQAGQQVTFNNNGTGPIAANNAGPIGSWTTRTLTFGANSTADFTFSYPDVGAIRLHARHNINASGNYMTGTTAPAGGFVVRPAGFTVTGIQRTADAFANPAAADAAGTWFIKAGDPMTLTVTAVNSLGVKTPNFGKESPNEGVLLTGALVPGLGLTNNPALGNGVIAGSAFGAGANAGIATVTNVTWGEVGIITITPSVGDGNYLGVGNVTGTVTGNIGRFTPHNFNVAPAAPIFATACTAGSFTYVGQPFSYAVGMSPVLTVTARNLGGGTTQNYKGTSPVAQAFFKITNTKLAQAPFTTQADRYSRYDALGGGNTPAVDVAGLPMTSADPAIVDNGNGTATLTFSAGTGLGFNRTTLVAPFDADISLAINVVDTDNVDYASNPARFGTAAAGSGIAFTGGKAMRFGRLRLGSVSGSPLLPLRVPLEAQYWNGTFFVTNVADSCTALTPVNVGLGNYIGNLTAGETTVSAVSTLSSGRGAITLSPPGAGTPADRNNGSVDVTVNLGNSPAANADACTLTPLATASDKPYLRGNWCTPPGTHTKDPAARARFGIRGGSDEIIYMRESY